MVDKALHSNINTIARGVAGGGSSSSSRRKYARHVLAANVISPGFLKGEQGKTGFSVAFSDKGVIRVNPHYNDLLVINV